MRTVPVASKSSSAALRRSRSGDDEDELEDGDGLPPESKVYTEKRDWSLDQLAALEKEGDLDLKPDYQRFLVWDVKQASRLVVTALEKRIVPTIYLEQDEEGKMLVIDGKQRLASLITFLRGNNAVAGSTWEDAPVKLDLLNDDSCHPKWHGKKFADLPLRRQRLLRSYSVACILVLKETPRFQVYRIYQDINMGSVGHTAQQSRKAAFHGPYMNLLDTLCHHKDFLQIQQRDEPDSKREYDRELVLRFLAMKRSYNVFKTPLASFLIEELVQHHQADTAELKRLEAMFKNTTSVVWQIWGPEACRKPAACGGRSAFSEPLWDATMVGVCEELEQAGNNRRRGELVGKAADIREAYKKLCADKTFEDNLKTNSRRNIQRRIAMLRGMLVEAAPPTRLDARRAFPNDIKRQLWAEPAARGRQLVCGLCNQIIHQVGDAEVDHVTPWSHGGATTASNAQLVHRYCNGKKGNRVAAT